MHINFMAIITSVILIISSGTIPSNAVWQGKLDPENARAVPILYSSIGSCVSSGFLYSPRIVFTAAHVLYEGDDRRTEVTKVRNMMWVGYPGETVSTYSRRVASEKIFTPNNFEGRDLWNGGVRITRKNDFAVIVLSAPLPVDSKQVELLTPQLHDQYIRDMEQISLTGYGYQTINDHRKCNEGRAPSSFSSKIIDKVFQPVNQTWTTTLNTEVEGYKPNMCDGDSGSGYVKITEGKYVYLGASGAGSYRNHNCEDYSPAMGLTTINGADPVYLYLDLIEQAKKYVLENPYLEPKTEITLPKKVEKQATVACKKGSTTKSLKSKCPKQSKKTSN
jgi:hypothetical protein